MRTEGFYYGKMYNNACFALEIEIKYTQLDQARFYALQSKL